MTIEQAREFVRRNCDVDDCDDSGVPECTHALIIGDSRRTGEGVDAYLAFTDQHDHIIEAIARLIVRAQEECQ